MPNAAFVDDDEIAQSVRTITRQRATKRIAVIVALIAAFFGLIGAVSLSYSDTAASTESE